MNKEELLKQQAKLQAELDKLKELIEQAKKSMKMGETYWYLSNYGTSIKTINYNEEWDKKRFNIGNYYHSEEKAKIAEENLLTYQALKDLALELNNGEEMDWTNAWSKKYCIAYNHDCRELIQSDNQINTCQGQIYCLNKNFLDIAKEKIGEDKLIQLIKYGV